MSSNDKNLKANAKALPKARRRSEIPFANSLLLVAEKLKVYEIVLVRGKPLSGKSVLLRQFQSQSPIKNIFEIRIERKISLENFIQSAEKVLGVHSEDQAEIDERMNLVLATLEQKQSLLEIYHLDRVEAVESFLSRALEYLSYSRILASCTSLPKISHSELFEIGLMDHKGFSREELTQFVLQIDERNSSKTDLIERLYDQTKGNPYLARLVLAQSKIENRLLEESDFHKAEEHIHDYLEKIFRQLDSKTQNQVSMIGLIKYDLDFANHLIQESFDELQIGELLSLGLIRKMESSKYEIDPVFVNLKHSSSSNDLENFSREELIKRIEGETSYNSSIEKIYQYKQLGARSEAAKILNQSIDEAISLGDEKLLTDLAKGLYNELPFQSFKKIMRSYISLGITEKGLAELRTYNPKVATDEANITSLKVDFLMELDRSQEAKALLQNIINNNPQINFSRAMALYDLAFVTDSPDLRLEAANEAEAILNQLKLEDYLLKANLYSVRGCAFDNLAQFKEASKEYQNALLLAQNSNDPLMELNALGNLCWSRYLQGELHSFLDLFQNGSNKSKEMKSAQYGNYFTQVYIIYLIDVGNLEAAERILPSSIMKIENSKPIDRSKSLFAIQAVLIQVLKGNLDRARNLFLKFEESGTFIRDQFFPLASHSLAIAECFQNLGNPFDQLQKSATQLARNPTVGVSLFNLAYRLSLSRGQVPKFEDLSQFENLRGYYSTECYRNSTLLFSLAIHGEPSSSKRFRKYLAGPSHPLLSSAHSLKYIAHSIALANGGDQLRAQIEIGQALELSQTLDSKAIERKIAETVESLLNQNVEINATNLKAKFLSQHLEQEDDTQATPILSRTVADLEIDIKKRHITANSKTFELNQIPQAVRLLALLEKSDPNGLDKEQICSQLWRETYNPLVHDTRIYTCVRRTRKFLVDLEFPPNVIEESDGRYQLKPDFKLVVV